MDNILGRLRVAMQVDSAAFETGMDRSAARVNTLGLNMGLARQRMAAFSQSMDQTGNSARNVGDKVAVAADKTGQMRAGVTNLGYQLQDITASFASGGKAATIFAQQSGQLFSALGEIAQASGKTSGILGGLAGFMGGPWGVAIGVGASVLGLLAQKFLTVGDAADESKAKVEDFKTTLAGMKDNPMQTLGKLNLDVIQAQAALARAQAARSLPGTRGDAIQRTNAVNDAQQALADAETRLGAAKSVANAYQKVGDAAGAVSKSHAQVRDRVREVAAAVVSLPQPLELTAQQLRMMDAAGTGAAAAMQKVFGAAALSKDQSKMLADRVASLNDRLFPEEKALRDFRQDVRDLGLDLKEGKISVDRYTESMRRLALQNTNSQLVVQGWAGSDDLQQRVQASTQAIQDAWNKTGQAANDNAARQEEAAQRTARSIEQMGNAIANSLSSLSSAFKSGDVLDILGALVQTGTSIYSTIKGVPGYAVGTDFHPGGLAMVGERGPELVNLPRGSQVYPHGKGPAEMGGSVGITVTPSEYFDVVVDRRVGRAAPQIADAGGRLGQMRVARARSRSLAR